MEPANPRFLTIHGGSSSITFTLFEAGDSTRRIPEGGISAAASRDSVRVICTDEELMMARSVCRIPGRGAVNKKD